MSEYTEVEQPFLAQLAAQGWTVIDQGTQAAAGRGAQPRSSFRSWWLPGVFREAVAAINTLVDGPDKGTPWLTERQIDELESQLFRQPQRTLLEANQALHELLLKAQVDVNEATGEADPVVVRLIDFHHPERNRFHVISSSAVNSIQAIPRTLGDCFAFGSPFVNVSSAAPRRRSSATARRQDPAMSGPTARQRESRDKTGC